MNNPFIDTTIQKADSTIKSERAYLISEILERVNKQREGTPYKPLTARAIAVKVGHINTSDLRDFFYQCDKTDNFSKTFFGRLKVDN